LKKMPLAIEQGVPKNNKEMKRTLRSSKFFWIQGGPEAKGNGKTGRGKAKKEMHPHELVFKT